MRHGYGNSEGYSPHLNADLINCDLENAVDIKGAIQFLKEQSYVDASRIIVVGQSTGRLATMAYLSIADGEVLGRLNFHGDVRPHNFFQIHCLMPGSRHSHVTPKTLMCGHSVYTENDHSSTPAFMARLYATYEQAGGQAELVQLPSFQNNGHFLLNRKEGLNLWAPRASGFINTARERITVVDFVFTAV